MDTLTKIGISICTGNTEEYNSFAHKGKRYYQYDYRSNSDGELFSCVKPSLQECRNKRDEWLTKKPIKPENEITIREASELFLEGELILAQEVGGMKQKSINSLQKASYYFSNEEGPITLNKVLRITGYRQYKLYKI